MPLMGQKWEELEPNQRPHPASQAGKGEAPVLDQGNVISQHFQTVLLGVR